MPRLSSNFIILSLYSLHHKQILSLVFTTKAVNFLYNAKNTFGNQFSTPSGVTRA
jgi:hypothetical protein